MCHSPAPESQPVVEPVCRTAAAIKAKDRGPLVTHISLDKLLGRGKNTSSELLKTKPYLSHNALPEKSEDS